MKFRWFVRKVQRKLKHEEETKNEVPAQKDYETAVLKYTS